MKNKGKIIWGVMIILFIGVTWFISDKNYEKGYGEGYEEGYKKGYEEVKIECFEVCKTKGNIFLGYSCICGYGNGGLGPLCLDGCEGDAGLIKGINGNAYKFNSSYVVELDYDSLNVLGSDDFKIDMWFKSERDTVADLIFKGDSDESWFSFTQRNSKDGEEIWLHFDDGEEHKVLLSNSSIDHEWHHGIIEFYRIDGGWNMKMFIDGILYNEHRVNNYGLLNNPGQMFLGGSCGVENKGRNKYQCWRYWGAMDELKIYHKDELIVYLDFELEGDKFKDKSGNNNHGVLKRIDNGN